MKKTTKIIALLLCAVLLVAGSVMGTLAYLTSHAEVKNTFTAGNVTITMDEARVDEYGVPEAGAARVANNTYKLIPGHTYTKDPTVKVGADSEDCWVFVKIENGLGDAVSITTENGWAALPNGYYAYTTKLSKNGTATPFKTFKFDQNADPSAYTRAEIKVTAYAIQADNFATYELAWAALSGQLSLQ